MNLDNMIKQEDNHLNQIMSLKVPVFQFKMKQLISKYFFLFLFIKTIILIFFKKDMILDVIQSKEFNHINQININNPKAKWKL